MFGELSVFLQKYVALPHGTKYLGRTMFFLSWKYLMDIFFENYDSLLHHVV